MSRFTIEAPEVPSRPRDRARAAARGRDELLGALERAEASGVLAPGGVVVSLAEPEAHVSMPGLLRGLGALSRGAASAVPWSAWDGGLPAPAAYVAAWEIDALASGAEGAEVAVPAGSRLAPPIRLARAGAAGSEVRVPGFLVHSFRGRKDHARGEIVEAVPAGSRRVLDVGCGAGAVAQALARGGVVATGIEPDAEAAEAARRKGWGTVVEATIEEALPRLLGGGFDAVIAADVLEHLEDPVAVLRSLRETLAPGGVLVASLPNASHAALLGGALQGRWDPALEGIVADDHRTYAGRPGWERLLRSGGFRVKEWRSVSLETPGSAPWARALAASGVDPAGLATVQWIALAEAWPGGAPGGEVDLGPSHADEAIPEADPLSDLVVRVRGDRDRGATRGAGDEARMPNALSAGVLEALFAGEVAAGPARRALAVSATAEALLRRLPPGGGLEPVAVAGEQPLPKAVARAAEFARRAGLPVAEAGLGSLEILVRWGARA